MLWVLCLAVLAALPSPPAAAAGPDTYSPAGEDDSLPADKFLYFAYGSNLLARRLHLMNPSAMRHAIGKLQGYRLDFSVPPSKRWGGAPATVVPDPGEHVWGAVWALDMADRDSLDDQEGVQGGWYDVFNATVETPAGEQLLCRSYRMHVEPAKEHPLPASRQPSHIYKRVVLAGARESRLPQDYIDHLEAIPDNGSHGIDPPISLDSLLDSQQPPAPAAK